MRELVIALDNFAFFVFSKLCIQGKAVSKMGLKTVPLSVDNAINAVGESIVLT